MTSKFAFFFIFIAFFSCERKGENYDDSRLAAFLESELEYSTESRKNLVILVLQNEECICTEENTKFALDIFKSVKYTNYEKLLFIKSNHHKILTNPDFNSKVVKIFINKDQTLEGFGLYFATDRIFLYEGGDLMTSDLHTNSINDLSSDYL